MIRIGFIGAGGYGRWHVEGFLSLQAEGLVQITAMADPSAAVVDALQARPELNRVRCFTEYRDMLAAGNLDAVVVSAPISFHREITLAALDRGLFILLEKPPVPLLSQLEELVVADPGSRVMVAFQHIYSGLIHRLKQDVAAGDAGRLLSISAHGLWPRTTGYYQRSGWAGQLEWNGKPVLDGPCTNACAHFVNIALYLAGDKLETFAMPSEVTGETYRARPGLPGYDTGCLTGTFAGGARFFIGFSHAVSTSSPVQIHIRGEKKTLCLLDDCETLRSGDGVLTKGDDGRDSMRRAFLAFAGGDRTQNRTPLHAMKAYVLATNMMFLSSGGIHTIPGEYVRAIDPETDRAIFAIENIASIFQECSSQFAPFYATSAPWAKKSHSIASPHFSEATMKLMLGMSTTAL